MEEESGVHLPCIRHRLCPYLFDPTLYRPSLHILASTRSPPSCLPSTLVPDSLILPPVPSPCPDFLSPPLPSPLCVNSLSSRRCALLPHYHVRHPIFPDPISYLSASSCLVRCPFSKSYKFAGTPPLDPFTPCFLCLPLPGPCPYHHLATSLPPPPLHDQVHSSPTHITCSHTHLLTCAPAIDRSSGKEAANSSWQNIRRHGKPARARCGVQYSAASCQSNMTAGTVRQ